MLDAAANLPLPGGSPLLDGRALPGGRPLFGTARELSRLDDRLVELMRPGSGRRGGDLA